LHLSLFLFTLYRFAFTTVLISMHILIGWLPLLVFALRFFKCHCNAFLFTIDLSHIRLAIFFLYLSYSFPSVGFPR
jgi:hypothetical protein